MDKSEKIYYLSAEMSKLIYDLGLNGWQNEFTMEKNDGTETVDVKIQVKIVRHKGGVK